MAARSRKIKPKDYQFKTEPRAHQLEVFMRCRDAKAFAILMEQGTGKTKVDLDSTAYSYLGGLIDTQVVIAPNGVQLNWINQEVPKHLPDLVKAKTLIWPTGGGRTKRWERSLNKALGYKGLIIFAMNIDAVITEAGKEALYRFLHGRQTKLTVDESTIIKNPKAKRTKVLLKAGPYAVQRRILTGTPVTTGPLDLFAQLNFLDPNILEQSSFYAFKHHYAEWEKHHNWAQGHDYEQLIGYRNLDELTARMQPISYRVTKAECLDLPEKIMMKRTVELSPKQRTLYKQLRDDYMIELEGGYVSATMALVRLLRLQQLICGYLPLDDEKDVTLIPGPNNRLRSMMDLSEELTGKTVIWARFRKDIELITAGLRKRFGDETVVTYDGSTPSMEAKEAARTAFQDVSSPVNWFVSNAQSGGRGVDLFAASNMIFYSNHLSWERRIQAEDRGHRDGLLQALTIIDFVAEDTVDDHILDILTAHGNMADGFMSNFKTWLG